MRSSDEIIQAALKEKRHLFEHEAKEVFRSLGVIVPRSEVIPPGREEAVLAAGDKLGYPLVLKAEASGVLHKTEAGAVMLDIKSRLELASALKQITSNLAAHVPGAVVNHFLLEKMMPPGLEVLIGGLRDEQFGPSVAFGLGGVWTEALREVAFGILPMTPTDVRSMVDTTKAAPFFREFRGAPALDRDAVSTVVNAVSTLMQKHDEIREIDLNPVRIYPRGAAALDARILLAL